MCLVTVKTTGAITFAKSLKGKYHFELDTFSSVRGLLLYSEII